MGAITSVAGKSESNKVDDGENVTLRRRRFTSMASDIAINITASAQVFMSEMASPFLSSERRLQQLREATEQLDALLQQPSDINVVIIIKHVRIIIVHLGSTWHASEIIGEQDGRTMARVLTQILARDEDATYPFAAHALAALLAVFHDEYAFEHHILGCLPAMEILAARIEHTNSTMVFRSMRLLSAFVQVAAHETPSRLSSSDPPTMRPLIRREYFISLIDQRGLIKPVARVVSPEYRSFWDFEIRDIITYFAFGNAVFIRYTFENPEGQANPIEVSIFALSVMIRNNLLAAYLRYRPSAEYRNRHYSEAVWKIVQAACGLTPMPYKDHTEVQGNVFHMRWLVTEGHICKLIANMIVFLDCSDEYLDGGTIANQMLVTVDMCNSLILIIRDFGSLEMYDARDFACEFVVNENGAQVLTRVMNVLHEIRKRYSNCRDDDPRDFLKPGESPPHDAPLEGWTWESIDDETPTQFLANIQNIDEVCNKLERCHCAWKAADLDEAFFIRDVNWTIYTGKIVVSVLRELIAAANADEEWRARGGGKMARVVL